jgi:hypothetical protein
LVPPEYFNFHILHLLTPEPGHLFYGVSLELLLLTIHLIPRVSMLRLGAVSEEVPDV